jgi:parallel beta-helix repeat protein
LNFESENAHGTPVSGPIVTDTIWDFAGSPYIVVDDVIVVNGVTLTIEPGVRVLFDGFYSIYVNGNLTAVGDTMNRIIITSNMAIPDKADWNNIQINSNGHADISYCDITYSLHGIYIGGALHNNIGNNNILFNGIGIYLYPSSNCTITNNNILDNDNGINVRASSDNVIIYNTISNYGIGIQLYDSSNITLTNNIFVNDGVFIRGDILQHFNSHTIPDNNIVNGQPLYYHKNSGGFNIDNIPVGQLILANCTDMDINNLEINRTLIAIQVAYSTNIMIANNNFSSNNLCGISFNSSSNNTITNNNLSNNGWGIHIEGSSNVNIITNNVSSNNIIGIGIGFSSFNNLISNNNVSDSDEGIYIGTAWMDPSSNNIVTNNYVSNNGAGISVVWASDNIISGNNISNNDYGIFFHSSSNNKIIDNNIIGNSISNGEYGLYFYDSSNGNIITGNTISNNNNGTYFEDSSNNIFANNIISNNGKGIILQPWAKNNVITGNTITWNDYEGVYIIESSNNTITGNHISDNFMGINISRLPSPNNIVRWNTVANNSYGIYIWKALDNSIYHNNLLNNTVQAVDSTNNGNQWDNGYPSGGNYWSDFDEPGDGAYDDYEGINQDVLGSDYIVDNGTIGGGGKNPYVIDADSQDNYPLINLSQGLILYEGWNLISIPRIQIDTNPGTVLSPISGSYSTIQWYNSTDLNDPWKHNSTTKLQHLNDFDSIDHLIGFWIYITEPGGVILEYSGPQPGAPENIPLHTGWNMVGFPSLSNKDRTTALNNLNFGVEVDAVWTFDAATQTWVEVGPSDSFMLGKGYWIQATQECVWEVGL